MKTATLICRIAKTAIAVDRDRAGGRVFKPAGMACGGPSSPGAPAWRWNL